VLLVEVFKGLVVFGSRFVAKVMSVGRILPSAAVALWVAAAGSPAGAAIESAYVVLGEGGIGTARVITTDSQCPTITVDGRRSTMSLRAAASGAEFPVTVCEAVLPPTASTAAVEGTRLPLLSTGPVTRIVVLGDSGCRMKKDYALQACNDVEAWPFASVARAAAASSPQVVIHVGDYLYREMPCPDEIAGCQGSPFGDNWRTWRKDFFDPAAPLLAAAPWVVVRGDHESCNRAGGGYFRFLDPRPLSPTCSASTRPYWISLGALELFMLDSNEGASDSADRVSDYHAQLVSLSTSSVVGAWIVTHMPIWGVRGNLDGKTLKLLTQSLQAAAAGVDLRQVLQVVSGHIHAFEALAIAHDGPSQLVVGTGGTSLDPQISQPLAGKTTGSALVEDGVSQSRFGFLLLERAEAIGAWASRFRDIASETEIVCEELGGRGALTCR
jgi:hypothetical protein